MSRTNLSGSSNAAKCPLGTYLSNGVRYTTVRRILVEDRYSHSGMPPHLQWHIPGLPSIESMGFLIDS